MSVLLVLLTENININSQESSKKGRQSKKLNIFVFRVFAAK